jgi:hypothetical protein
MWIVSALSATAVHTCLTQALFNFWTTEKLFKICSTTIPKKEIKIKPWNKTECQHGRQSNSQPLTLLTLSFMFPEDIVFQEFLAIQPLQRTIKLQITESLLMEQIPQWKFLTLVHHISAMSASAYNLHPFLKPCKLLFLLLSLLLILILLEISLLSQINYSWK